MSAPVLHGRRKGLVRSPQIGIDYNNQPHSAMLQPDIRQVTVLKKEDWERIQYQLNKRTIEQEKIRGAREAKERLHQLSKERVKNWSNTIVGQRQRKLEARKIRDEKEEEEKKAVDIEEAKYQAEKRKEAIEKAKTQQYYQTDRVKGFHGALILTEVLKERDAQLELKALKEKANNGNDKEWSMQSQQELEKATLKAQMEALEQKQKMREIAVFQKAQIHGHLNERDFDANKERIEGEELKRLAAQYEMEKKRLEEIRNAEARQLMSDNLKQIEDVEKMRHVLKQQDEEEDEECRIFAAAKRKMMKLRLEKEKQLHNEKQERLEKIRSKLHAQLQQLKDDEDERIRRALEEAEAKRVREEAQKEAQMRKVHEQIAKHRDQVMMESEREAAENRQKELEMLAIRREADDLFALNEAEKQRRKFEEAKGLEGFLLGQANERKTLTDKERDEQLALDKRNEELIGVEEKQFQEYARRVIDHCEKSGRNTIPLKKAAREGAGGGLGPVFPGKGGIRPSYMTSDQSGVQMPNYQRGTTDEVKESIYGKGPTSKRLGFVW
ncbi:hypothetical protein LSH36_518g02010 [Paralvinella palmiformis]|uniref:Trichohyalin-plectin-homology domain-containing protein n=1 Tax=Paralvinella palmiformis TaxID=53620 RepID=A0AAD9J9B4_9ANNE|nr:hypothetical protein LSH36_518g02010 [Paralvinella palmiformis]